MLYTLPDCFILAAVKASLSPKQARTLDEADLNHKNFTWAMELLSDLACEEDDEEVV